MGSVKLRCLCLAQTCSRPTFSSVQDFLTSRLKIVPAQPEGITSTSIEHPLLSFLEHGGWSCEAMSAGDCTYSLHPLGNTPCTLWVRPLLSYCQDETDCKHSRSCRPAGQPPSHLARVPGLGTRTCPPPMPPCFLLPIKLQATT